MIRWLFRQLLMGSFYISRTFDKLLPAHYSVDGWTDFCYQIAPGHFRRGIKMYDVGGGKSPYLSREKKTELEVKVVGVDIDAAELAAAPPGAYDKTICEDICDICGEEDGDIVISVSVLEHVRDVGRALKGIASLLKPGGKALIFLPSRSALYAKLNRLLPQRVKRSLLGMVMPGSLSAMGFQAYYDRCTPEGLTRLAEQCGFAVESVKRYYYSPYLMYFFPLHIAARLRMLLLRLISDDMGVETFSIVLQKRCSSGTSGGGDV